MFALLLILIVVLFGFGFLSPVWWVVAASVVLVFGAIQYGRRGEGGGWDRGGSSDLREHQDHRKRRYRPRHRERWKREARRDREHRGPDTTPREELPLSTARDAALLAEVGELRAANEQLERAMASRAVIDQACGMVMALAPCTSERAWDLLVGVSQRCNIKLRDVAAALIATTKDEALPEPVRQELRQALRRLHSADRR